MKLRTVVFLSILIFLVDRFTKYIAYNYVSFYAFTPWLAWSTAVNTGISWGMFQDVASQELLILFTVGLLACFLFWILQEYAYIPWYSAMVVTGAVSNMIDRVWYGGVVDFISVHIFGWQYPIFNVADCAIVLGIIYFFYIQSVGDNDEK